MAWPDSGAGRGRRHHSALPPSQARPTRGRRSLAAASLRRSPVRPLGGWTPPSFRKAVFAIFTSASERKPISACRCRTNRTRNLLAPVRQACPPSCATRSSPAASAPRPAARDRPRCRVRRGQSDRLPALDDARGQPLRHPPEALPVLPLHLAAPLRASIRALPPWTPTAPLIAHCPVRHHRSSAA